VRFFACWFSRGAGLAVFGAAAGVTFRGMRTARPEDGFFGLLLGCFAVSVGVVVGILALIVRDKRS